MQWEYVTKHYEFKGTVEGTEAFEGALNNQGRKHWELASCHQQYNSKTKTWSARCIFKRPLADAPVPESSFGNVPSRPA